ncbi:acetyoacetyl CoA reductase [Legionella santicrucis]|uniref:Acetyoacetyl CoA reductase n=1 Tax=Legionella santicrucis TaxID=45074 RepID=A0A0W0YJA8_9GAMM|nr:SDR family oxidoreductase [Legionella santicrucis]KTD56976.1 acetyoacetyl CoA reductase [Legionella santicrucis]
MRNKHVVITGGVSGIGSAIIDRCYSEGAKVCCIDIQANSHPKADISFQCDISNEAQVEQAFKQIKETWQNLDILINNAGISIRESFLKTTAKHWDHTLAVNLTGPFLVTKAAMSIMATGTIINIASVSGIVGMPNYLSYNVSKAGLIELTKTLALELAPNFRVNAICPGYVLTPMQEKEYSTEALMECAKKIPLQRLSRPEEIAALVSYLCSDEARFITGQSLIIDGGELAGGLASR